MSMVAVAPAVDPLVKREQFAVSLRRQKKQEIINKKRQLLIASTHKMINNSDNRNDQMLYHDCEQFLLESGFEIKAVIRAQVPELDDLSGI